MPQLGAYPHGALRGRSQVVIPPANPGDKPVILRPDDRPKKQATNLLKAQCPECGYIVRVTRKWAAVGLPICPTDRIDMALEGGTETGEADGHVLAPAAVKQS